MELAAEGARTAAVQGDQGLDILQLVLHASLPVQLVMVLLLLASAGSWVIILRKKWCSIARKREADRFEEEILVGHRS